MVWGGACSHAQRSFWVIPIPHIKENSVLKACWAVRYASWGEHWYYYGIHVFAVTLELKAQCHGMHVHV